MSYDAEALEAKQTFELSVQTASRFLKNLGALAPILIPPFPSATLGRRPGFQATVLDHKYWFAKLYELVTYQEMSYSIRTQQPGFSLHFMKVFYGMYYDSLQNFLNHREVGVLWKTHFTGPSGGHSVDAASMQAVQFSVRTGAIAHIQGDMPAALATAYQTWKANPKPAFQDLREDFITRSEGAFRSAQAGFYLEVNDKTWSPLRPEVGQFAAAQYQIAFNIQPSLEVMFEWRREAWERATQSI